jgi:NAD(P)-dependent dehydrogenase (short-subunit alcohol dehydrogenase family)
MESNVMEMMNLSGKTAIITGGAGLLGEKHAEAIAEAGGIPVILDINEEKISEVTRSIRDKYNINCQGFNCDITNIEDLQKCKSIVLSKFGCIDILINNAALDPKVTKDQSGKSLNRLEDFDIKQWNLELAVGLTGAFLCTQVFGAEMAKNNSGVIINVSSDLGIIAPDQRLYRQDNTPELEQSVKPVTYSVIKHGLIGLTKYITTYWAKDGIRANTLCPAGVFNNQPEEFINKISELIPMGRMAHKDEYKAAIVFLASNASTYMNGQTLIIDGGRSVL